MKPFAAPLLALVLAALPAGAQDSREPEEDELSEGMQMLQDGTRLLLRGLMEEIGPALEELEGRIDDLNAYLPPEVLPNGDIIIRRKVPLQPEHLDDDPEGEVEL